jgi:capsular polysaccharide biosynthesis protein
MEAARIHYRSHPAPAALGSAPAVVDDPLMASVVRARAERPRWEAAWCLRGDVRITSGHPLVFVNGRLVPESVSVDDYTGGPLWRHYARQAFRRPAIEIDRAVLCREPWDANYWHLLDGVLPRFAMAAALGIAPEIPAIVSSAFVEQHGRKLAGTGFATERPLVVQNEGQTVRCRELYLLRPASVPSHWMADVMARIPDEPAGSGVARRIHCRRAPKSGLGRTAENTAEIDRIFRDAGFSVIDPTDMTLARQKAIFSAAETIAGINGAAFANGLFRHGRTLAIGSLISANWMSTVFPTMARVHGFRFVGHVVRPSGNDMSAGMFVPPDAVRRLIDRIL